MHYKFLRTQRSAVAWPQGYALAHHEVEAEAVERPVLGAVQALHLSPQLDRAHQDLKALVNGHEVAQHLGLEAGCVASHTDITVQACTVPGLLGR